MREQLTGAASVATLALCYVLLVECLMAAIVILGEFTVLRIRALRKLLKELDDLAHEVAELEEPKTRIQVGGGIIKWH